MTEDLERRLAQHLRSQVPDPPRLRTAQDVWDDRRVTRPRRPVTRVAGIVGAAALVAGLAIVVSLHTTRRDSATPPTTTHVPTRPTTDPRALVGPTWVLTSVQREGGPSTQIDAAAASTLDITSSGVITDEACSVATSSLGTGLITFYQDFVNGLVAGHACGPRVPIAQERFVIAVLHDTVTWAISDDTLTIRHPAIGVLTFHGIRPDAVITGELIVSGGPSDAVGPGAGTVVLRPRIGYPVRIRTRPDGTFSTHVVPGEFELSGHDPHLSAVPCDGSPATVQAHQTVHVRIVCPIR